MGVVRVRIPDEVQAVLKKADFPIALYIRTSLEAAALEIQLRRRDELLAKVRGTAPPSAARLVRDVRDEH